MKAEAPYLDPGQNYQQLGSNKYEWSDDPNVGRKHKLQPYAYVFLRAMD